MLPVGAGFPRFVGCWLNCGTKAHRNCFIPTFSVMLHAVMMQRRHACLHLAVLLLVGATNLSSAGRLFQTDHSGGAQQGRILSSAIRQLAQSRPPLLGLDSQNKKLRVLAFGDSITEGWINSAYIKVPWSPRVQQKLQQKLGQDWNVEVVNGGVGSAGVLDRLNDAFRQQLSNARSEGRPYHYITFEAGINDLLLQHRNAPEILERMKELWRLANAEGSTVVVIPTLPTNVGGEREDQRLALTDSVRKYIKEQRAAGNRGLFLLDLEAPFSYFNMSPERRQQVFDDGVHLTVYGYELLGDLVAEGLARAMGLGGAGSERANTAEKLAAQAKGSQKAVKARKP